MTDANVVSLPTQQVHPLKKLKDDWISPPADMIQKINTGRFMADYFGHAETTDALLDSDLFWSWEPAAFNANGAPLIEEDPSGNMWTMWIKLTVHGVTRWGCGSCKKSGKDDVTKELIGDAIRNAAMRFGVALNLWAKSELASAVPADEPKPRDVARKADAPKVIEAAFPGATEEPNVPAGEKPISAPQINLIKSLLRGRTDLADVAAEHALMSQLVGREIKSTKDLTMPEAKRVIDTLKAPLVAKAEAEYPNVPFGTES